MLENRRFLLFLLENRRFLDGMKFTGDNLQVRRGAASEGDDHDADVAGTEPLHNLGEVAIARA